MLRPRNSMDLLSSASLSESMTSIRAVFRRLKRALFGGAFLFPTESRSPCCSTRSIPIDGITKEKQLHFLDLTERSFGLKSETSPLPIKCRLRDRLSAHGHQISFVSPAGYSSTSRPVRAMVEVIDDLAYRASG